MKVAAVLIVFSFLLFFAYDHSFAQTDSRNTLQVSFVNNTAASYVIDLDSNEIYTLSQKYSWVRDQNSRYNLVSYSLDGQDFSSISRQSRGNFILDVPTDSSRTVVFLAVTQYPVSVLGVNEYSFSPKSPTGDNWFDAKSEIKILDITSNNDGLFPYEIGYWEGPAISSSGNSAEILVDGPIEIEAIWTPNYSPLAFLIGLPIVAIVVFLVKRRHKISQMSSPQPDIRHGTSQPDTQQSEIDDYREKIQEYLKQKSFKKLELFLKSKSISNEKYLGIKETLWEI
ncbi:hypothetical protein [Nitrosopumilus sp.]|uniref:hypothetical protein n=1 Tax=Nitrosopumilus sp. TaxID=2024843 RepID=UPI002629C8C0|nr:hypothetical protein [Nitrosopumilus sp.]